MVEVGKMESVRYIHAADLHLDAPFLGLAKDVVQEGHLARRLRTATADALEHLFQLCEKEQPDFLILAGDVYNEENHSVKLDLHLKEGCERLQKLGIQVFIVHGNRDPLISRRTAINLPSNVTIFDSSKVSSYLVKRNDSPIAQIYGISHASANEDRNLVELFKRDQNSELLQIGILHINIEGEGEANGCPTTSLEELENINLDAWALGHVHDCIILSQQPFIAYPGCLQGLTLNEDGPRGCLLVNAEYQEERWQCACEFIPLAPVTWEKLHLNISGLEKIEEIEKRLLNLLEDTANKLDPQIDSLIARVTLSGQNNLDSALHNPETLQELRKRTTHLSSGKPRIWLNKLLVETTTVLTKEDYLRRDDFLGETLRLVEALHNDPAMMQKLCQQALEPLYLHPHIRRALKLPNANEMLTLLQEAERLCINLLEVR